MESKIPRRGAFREITKILEELQHDLLFTLMASDKELFHSNVHARLFQNNPELKKVFFEKFSLKNADQQKDQVIREYKKIDLYMNHPGFDALAIENKLFADLGDNQLDRYMDQLKKSKNKFIIGIPKFINFYNLVVANQSAEEFYFKLQNIQSAQ